MSKIDRRASRLISLVILGSLVALMFGCTPAHPQSTFDTLGPVSRIQANLFYIIFWIGLVVFIGVEGAILYIAFKYRRKRGQEGDPEQMHGNQKLEVAWTIAPALLLTVLAVPSTIAIFDTMVSPHPPEEGGLVIEVTGHQWWFEFRYPDLDVITANEMHIPVGEVVNLRLASVDVIHSFWVPKLAGKVDMIPNNDNTMWLQADAPGEYYGQCAEFCGVSHANMRFKVIAQPMAEFETWAKAQAANAVASADPLVKQGEEVFVTGTAGNCIRCHAVKGNRLARGRVGPDLSHVASRGFLAAGLLRNTDEAGNVNDALLQANLRTWLEDPEAVKPGNIMSRDAEVYNGTNPPLTEAQLSALIAYLTSLK